MLNLYFVFVYHPISDFKVLLLLQLHNLVRYLTHFFDFSGRNNKTSCRRYFYLNDPILQRKDTLRICWFTYSQQKKFSLNDDTQPHIAKTTGKFVLLVYQFDCKQYINSLVRSNVQTWIKCIGTYYFQQIEGWK